MPFRTGQACPGAQRGGSMDRLLLLEDDESLIDGLQYALEKNGFALTAARSVREAEELWHRAPGEWDLLLLDVGLPDGTGFELCETVRAGGSQVPILFLTAADEEVQVIRGLDCGGDDYVTKPFKLGELCSRIRALLRRSSRGQGRAELTEARLCAGAISIDLMENRAYREGRPLELTAAEYRLLCLLVRNAGRVLTRGTILDALWDGNGNFVDDNTLSVYIRRLREKVEKDPSEPQYLETVRGFGYRWKGIL